MNFPYERAIVTGGAGFIGSHICDKLVDLGVDVICIDNLSTGKLSNVEHLLDYSNFGFVNIDICNKAISPIMNDVDIVFHNAASKKTICLNDPQRDLEVNAGGTLNLLLAAEKAGVKKFVHASTGSVYGEPKDFPTNEYHCVNPVSYYGVSKLAGEKYVNMFDSIDTTILRYFHVYGPRQDCSEYGGVISIFINKLLNGKDITIFGSGNQERSFTFVDDIVNVNIEAAINKNSSNQIYNCASGIKVSIIELAKALINKINYDCNIVYGPRMIGDIDRFDIDNSKIEFDLGIKFLKDIDIGLEKTVESFK